MKKSLIYILLAISFIFLSNSATFYSNGENITPIYETDIELKKELLILEPKITDCKVKAIMEFYNPGPKKILLVGFVTPGIFEVEDIEPPKITNMTIVVNGKKVGYKGSLVQNTAVVKEITDKTDSSYVFLFNAEFDEGVNKIEHTYTIYGLYDNTCYTEYRYRLSTGLYWANKEIEHFEMRIIPQEKMLFDVNNYLSKDKYVLSYKIIGLGNAKIEEVEPEKLTLYYFKKGYLSLVQKHFKPDYDVYIKAICTYGQRVKYYLREEYKLYEIHEDLITVLTLIYLDRLEDKKNIHQGDIKELLLNLTKNELLLARNFIFAKHGVIFNNPFYDDFYNKTIFYIPDPSVKQKVSLLSSYDLNLLYTIDSMLKTKK